MPRHWLWTIAIAVGLVAGGARGLAQGGSSGVPGDVLKAFQQAYPAAAITASRPERQDGRTVYRIDARDKGRRRIAVYDRAASLIESAGQVEEKELPAPVVAAIRSHRRAMYVTGMKVTRKGAVHYELTLRGSRRTAMIVKPDGAVVSFQ